MVDNPYKAPAENGNASSIWADWRFLAVFFYWMPIVVLGAVAIGFVWHQR
jgi:hypothetical protein